MRIFLLFALGLAATAGATPPPERLTFARAVGIVDELPTLAARRQAVGRERTSSVPLPWQPLVVRTISALRFAPSGDRGVEGGLGVEQAIPLADIRGARRAVREAIADQHAAEASAAALEARLEVARTWIDGWAARQRLVAAGRDADFARTFVAVSERAMAAGVLTTPELADARAFLAEAELRRLDAEGMLADASFATARSLGRAVAIASEGDLPAPPIPAADARDALVVRARHAPAAIARRVAARASRVRAAEERATRAPQFLVGGAVDRDGPGALVASISFGIAFPHDRGEREVRGAETAAHLAEADAEVLAMRATIELTAALHEVDHTREVLAEVTERLVPATDDAAARRQRAFEVGETTLVEVLAARRTANAARARATDARAAHAWARVRTWLLVQALDGAR